MAMPGTANKLLKTLLKILIKLNKMHPYKRLKPYQNWTKAVSNPSSSNEVDIAQNFSFKMSPEDKIATAGSCFAQHISRHLSQLNLQYYVAEKGSYLLNEDLRKKFNYNIFSARYGNIYTSKQLRQLLLRATGKLSPLDNAWRSKEGKWFDPYRPSIEPNGFASNEEMLNDRDQHLKSVLEMFSKLDVFIFTLGLTETWMNSEDGVVYPICPGVLAGTFNNEKHQFLNLKIKDVIEDMNLFLLELGEINPKAQTILTVSPVALKATAIDRHIIESNTVSKSILRAAADQLQNDHENVHYFPSFEIITSLHNRGKYIAEDSRSILETGVNTVMSQFAKHATTKITSSSNINTLIDTEQTEMDVFQKEMENIVTSVCDEDYL